MLSVLTQTVTLTQSSLRRWLFLLSPRERVGFNGSFLSIEEMPVLTCGAALA